MFNNSIKFKNNQQGQVLLIVILVMVVALTIGLSVASRSIVSLRTSTEQAESQKALAAAEAGIEQAIKANSAPVPGQLGNASYVTSLSDVNGTNFVLNGGNPISKNDGFDLWLSDYSTSSAEIYQNQRDANLTIYWGDSSDGCSNAALEVAVISGNRSNPTLTKYAFDACQDRQTGNNFTYISGGGGTVSGETFPFGTTIAVTSGFIVRIIPLYANANVGVLSSADLPNQGKVITSTGASGATERKITVFQSYPSLPVELFPYNLFSP